MKAQATILALIVGLVVGCGGMQQDENVMEVEQDGPVAKSEQGLLSTSLTTDKTLVSTSLTYTSTSTVEKCPVVSSTQQCPDGYTVSAPCGSSWPCFKCCKWVYNSKLGTYKKDCVENPACAFYTYSSPCTTTATWSPVFVITLAGAKACRITTVTYDGRCVWAWKCEMWNGSTACFEYFSGYNIPCGR